MSAITEYDLTVLGHLVPPSGAVLLRLLGVPSGLALINGLGGAQLWVPKGPCNHPGGARTWAYLAQVVGESAVVQLATEMGGQVLEVPLLDALRKERRNGAIRAQFNHLTARSPQGVGLSKASAIRELCLRHAPITGRQLETIVDRPSNPDPVLAQGALLF